MGIWVVRAPLPLGVGALNCNTKSLHLHLQQRRKRLNIITCTTNTSTSISVLEVCLVAKKTVAPNISLFVIWGFAFMLILLPLQESSQNLVQGLVLLNCVGGMNNNAIVDDWRIKLLLPLLWFFDFLLKQKVIALQTSSM
ncbi:hypothetical protein Pint_06873 [Pistacia integerrima]|uniref:Uncharacterized protein n=1 Tax=Pistacia integerrima TaxID=434235 RepID=A0ACC0XUZ6_9ROSI|nr:hypothetical protein Pint_06873 [Pistacia integerrima]